jgi:conjugal transfer mating pair stabilization protein TraG
MYEIFAYFNVTEITAVLNSVAALMGSGDFNGAVKTLTMLGFVGFMGMLIFTWKGFDHILTYFLALMFFYGVLFVPKVTVTVIDRSGYQAPAVVDNVPVGLAFFATTASKIGEYLTRATETVFSLPDDLKFQKNGMMFGSKLILESRRASIQDPTLRHDMIMYIRNCVNPDVLDGYLDPDVVRKAPNIWAILGDTNPGRWTSYNGGGVSGNCPSAYAYLSAKWAAEVNKNLDLLGFSINPNAPDVTQANALFQAQLVGGYSALLNAGSTASEIIQQNMMINVFNDAATVIPQMMGDPSATNIALAKAQADAVNRTQYATMALIGEEALPKVRNVFELLILGMFPFMYLILLLAGYKGFSVLKNYIMFLFWVQLWAPLYAILNFIGTNSAAAKMKSAVTGTSGLAMSNADMLQNVGLSEQSIVGMLTLSVPVIAWGIVKLGEISMGSMAASAVAPATSAGGQAAAQAATGTTSLGSRSFDNLSSNNTQSNKSNIDAELFGGAFKSRDSNGATWQNFGGGVSTYEAAQNNPGPMIANASKALSSQLTKSADYAQSQAKTLQTQGQTQIGSALAQSVGTANTRVNSAALEKQVGSTEASKMALMHNDAVSTADRVSKGTGYNSKTTAQVMAQVSANASLGISAAGTGFVTAAKTALGKDYNESAARKLESNYNNESQESRGKLSEYHKALQSSEAFRSSIASNSTDTNGINANLSQGQSKIKSSGAKLEEANSLREQASRTSSAIESMGVDLAKSPALARPVAAAVAQINHELAMGNLQGAVNAAYEFGMNHGGGGQRVGMPTAYSDGKAVPTAAGLSAGYQLDAAKVNQQYDPKADFNANNPKVNVAPVGMPDNLKSIPEKIRKTGGENLDGYIADKQSFAIKQENTKEKIGVVEGTPTKDNPNGPFHAGSVSADHVKDNAKIDLGAAISGLKIVAPGDELKPRKPK